MPIEYLGDREPGEYDPSMDLFDTVNLRLKGLFEAADIIPIVSKETTGDEVKPVRIPLTNGQVLILFTRLKTLEDPAGQVIYKSTEVSVEDLADPEEENEPLDLVWLERNNRLTEGWEVKSWEGVENIKIIQVLAGINNDNIDWEKIKHDCRAWALATALCKYTSVNYWGERPIWELVEQLDLDHIEAPGQFEIVEELLIRMVREAKKMPISDAEPVDCTREEIIMELRRLKIDSSQTAEEWFERYYLQSPQWEHYSEQEKSAFRNAYPKCGGLLLYSDDGEEDNDIMIFGDNYNVSKKITFLHELFHLAQHLVWPHVWDQYEEELVNYYGGLRLSLEQCLYLGLPVVISALQQVADSRGYMEVSEIAGTMCFFTYLAAWLKAIKLVRKKPDFVRSMIENEAAAASYKFIREDAE